MIDEPAAWIPRVNDRVVVRATGATGTVRDLIEEGGDVLCQVEHDSLGAAAEPGELIGRVPEVDIGVYSPGELEPYA
jgi:hypothetical protein